MRIKNKISRMIAGILALAMTAAVASTTLIPVSASSAQTWTGQVSFAQEFANPPSSTKPMTRFWWPNAPQDLDELEREVRAIAEAGYGGIEIACVADSSGWVDPVEYGWGTEGWNNAVRRTLQTAKEVGIKVDLTVGPHWPLSIPGVNPDTPDSAKKLSQGSVKVEAGTTYAGEAPAADEPLKEPWTVDELKAVTAAKITGYDEETAAYTYDVNSMQEVTAGEDGTVHWTAPDDGDYMLFSYWMRGTGQRAQQAMNPSFELSDPIPYTVDHFSLAGTNAFIDFWKDNMLPDDILALLREVGGSMFEDSLELSGNQWTAELLDYFEEHRGYDLTPYLPVIEGADIADAETTARITEDYSQTLNDMYIEYHVLPMQEFMNSIGLTFRTQSYGGCVDSSQTGSLVDIIEGELLTFSSMGIGAGKDNTVGEWTADNKFKMLRGGANLGRSNILSDEIGSLLGAGWSLSLDNILSFMNNDFSAGVNNMVLHGFPYRYAPGAKWPTYAAFSPLNFRGMDFGVSLNNYTPTWEALDEMLDYVHRMQYVLQSGKSTVDIAIYRHELSTNGKTIPDGTLVDKGYTYDYVSPNAFDNEKAYVKDGVFAPEGGGYRAMIVYDTEYITLDGAQKLIEYADAGLPIIIAKQIPSKTKGFGQKDRDSEVAALMTELLAKDNVSFVSEDSELTAAVEAAGILPSTEFQTTEPKLTTVRRELPNADYYYLFNRSYDRAVDVDVTLQGSGTPYLLNAYTGEVTRLSNYTVGNGTITIRVTLDSRDTQLIAIGGEDWYSDDNASLAHVTSGDVRTKFDQNGLSVTAEQPGDYTVTLSDGTTVETTVSDVAQPVTLNRWHLSLESWEPANFDAEGNERFETSKTTYETDLDTIVPWSEMEKYKDVSGIGTYTTTISLDQPWTGGYNAVLDLGNIENGFEVFVNGEQVMANQITHTADLGGYLRQGDNEITVRVVSELINTQIVLRPDKYEGRTRTVNGLTENPVLTPYGVALVQTNQKVSKDILEKVIAYAQDQKDNGALDNVIPLVAEAYNTRLEAANALLNSLSATQQEVDEAWVSLMEIIHYLDFIQGNKNQLDTAIAYAESLNLNDYQEQGQAEFLAALADAKKVQADENALQYEVDEARDNLTEATLHLLLKTGDKAQLNLVIRYAQQLELENYLDNGKQAFIEALEKAVAVQDDKTAVQSAIDAAVQELTDALLELRLKPDKTLLANLLQEAGRLELSGYTAETAEYFASAREAAQAVYDNPQASQAEVEQAEKTLKAAMEALEAAPVAQIQGDGTATTANSSPKTGESLPVAAAALLLFAAAGLTMCKRRK